MTRRWIACFAAALLATTADCAFAQETPSAGSPAAQPAAEQPAVAQPAADPSQNVTPPAAVPEPAATIAAPAVPADPLRASLQQQIDGNLQHYLHKASDREAVAAFYKSRDYAPLWVSDGKPTAQVGQIAAYLKGVAADGLDPADYPMPSFSATDPAQLAADELTLTSSVATYVHHASTGRIAFSRVSASIYYNQKQPDIGEVLNTLSSSADVRGQLASYEPQSEAYRALKAKLAAVRDNRAIVTGSVPVAEETSKKRSRAHANGKSESAKPAVSADVIIANMERWRWMPHDLGSRYVMVNVPDYTLKVVQDGKTIWTTKIVAGQPGERATPLIAETMKSITINPTWNVPPSIIRNEYLPALARDPEALSRVGLQVGRNKDGSIRIFQPPSDKNALGRIRFNFPNRFLVYQHDTPNKNLFARSERALSHGCMRVQHPDEYAQVLLGMSQPEDHYTAARVRAMYGKSERSIGIKQPIPVYVTYQTVFVDDSGKLQTRADIYGRDKEMVKILHSERAIADKPVARNYNSSSKPVMAGKAKKSRVSSVAPDVLR